MKIYSSMYLNKLNTQQNSICTVKNISHIRQCLRWEERTRNDNCEQRRTDVIIKQDRVFAQTNDDSIPWTNEYN